MEITKKTAAETYAEKAAGIAAELEKIEELLASHAMERASNPRSWALVGDVSKVFADLVDIRKFLTNED